VSIADLLREFIEIFVALDALKERLNGVPVSRLVNNQAACKRLIDSLITINPIKSSSPVLIFSNPS
jgi:hypothetical protein